jgi:succinoglycan biosynthesis protein ExoM
MNILVCICTYKRNFLLKKCIQSIDNAFKPTNFKISILIIDNTLNSHAKNLIKSLKKKISLKVYYINEKKRGVVHARNKALCECKKIYTDYICFFDDDCTIDKYWFRNAKKLINEYPIITGPQIYEKNNIYGKNFSSMFEKKYNKDSCLVNWAATNNVIFRYNIIKHKNLIFDYNLNNFSMGEDQLFFSKLRKLGNNIVWSKNLKVYENYHLTRSKPKVIILRSFKLGILGHYIDKKIYGSLIGLMISYFKSIFFFILAVLELIKFYKKNNFFYSYFYFVRFCGKILGPMLFKQSKFYIK